MSDFAIPLPRHGRPPADPRVPTALTSRALAALGDRRLSALVADGGGDAAFEAIYARYHQPLYRYCHSIVRDSDDAADALQSAMLKAFLALPAKKPEAALKPWLFRIVHNEAISVIRRRNRHEQITDANAPQTPSVDEEADSRGRLAELVDDLQQLEERQRAALVMRELNGLAYHEIAAAFATTPAAAKQAVYDARLALHARAEGRAMSCEPVRYALSAGDRRKLRARTLRAHLRACAECRRFESAIAERRGDLAALSPALPGPAAAALLKGILVGSGGAQGGAGAALGTAAYLAGVKALTAVLSLAGAAAIGTAFDGAGPRPARETSVPAALTRPAPPLTKIYMLSAGQAPVARLRQPAPSIARKAATRPVAGRAASRSGGRPAARDAASRPARFAHAPLTAPPRVPAGRPGLAEGGTSLPLTPPHAWVPPVVPPSVSDVPAVAVPAPVEVPAAPRSPAVQLPQLPSLAPVPVPPARRTP
jgi:RNA polymerase sigma factor (sigma-70 family)